MDNPTAELCDLLRALARTEHSDFLLAADVADVIASQAERIGMLEGVIGNVATDIEKWFGDGIKPDEWKLKEWADRLRALVPAPINPIEHEQTR